MQFKSALWGLVFFGGLVCVPPAYPAGELDGAFFKVTYHSVGVNFNADGILSKGNSTGVCFTKLVFDGGSSQYTGAIACETAPDVWALTDAGFELQSLGDGTAISNDQRISCTNAKGHFVTGFGTSLWTPKLDASGALKSATGKVLGSEACCASSLDSGTSSYLGELRMTAVTVDADKVPMGAFDLLQ